MNLFRELHALCQWQIQIIERQVGDVHARMTKARRQRFANSALAAALAAAYPDNQRPWLGRQHCLLNGAFDQISGGGSGLRHLHVNSSYRAAARERVQATRLGGVLPAKKLSRLSAICMPMAVRA